MWFHFVILKNDSKIEEFRKWFVWKVYVFQVWFIMVKAWFDIVWYEANFYVHIKSQGPHGVYEPHDEKAGLCVQRSV